MPAPLPPEDLLPGEAEVRSYRASFYVVAADWGTTTRAGTPFAGRFGMRGVEAVGGALHLTNWRLIFVTGALNRFTGRFAIVLSQITAAKDASRGIKRAVRISTGATAYEFNLWGIARFLSALEAERAALDKRALEAFVRASEHAPEPRDPFRRR
jgi:hypothetical protein